MKLKFVFLLFLVLTGSVFSQEYSRVKVITNEDGLKKLSQLGIAIDHGSHKTGQFFISDFSKEEIATMKNNGFACQILIDDVQKFYVEQNNKNTNIPNKNSTCDAAGNSSTFSPITPSNFQLGSMAGFLTYQEMLDNLDLMQQLYPNLISTKSPISTFLTIENRPIYWVRMSDNPSTDENNEKEILYSSVHHAREPNSLSATIYYMWYLLENYANSTEIQHILNNSELYFVPCLNPDGYLYNEATNPNGGGMHRKNRRNVGTSNKGVDLNRNYSHGWGTTGTSTNPNNDTYCGTAPFSEPETQAMKWFCENHNFILAFNAHTYSNDILFPFGNLTNEFAEDHDYFDRFTGYMVQYNGYVNMKSSSLYEASGDSDDYMYASDLTIKPKIFAMTPEIGDASEGFWPPINKIEENCANMLFPNLTLAHLAHRYLTVKDLDPQRIGSSTGSFHHEVERIGLDSGDVILQIQPLLNLTSVGSPITYDLAKITPVQGSFNYVLSSSIEVGDTIKYILETVYPTWTKRDTIVKIFGVLPVFVFDDASSGSNWIGGWSTESHTVHSPSKAYSDSEAVSTAISYSNSSFNDFQYTQAISLVNATAAEVSFFAKWEIETDYDFCQFQVSTDGGNSWIPQCGKYTVFGTSDNGSAQPAGEPVYEGTKDWVREEISLSDYLGQTIHLRFVLGSDNAVNQDGFYFDDFTISVDRNDLGLSDNQQFISVYPNPANHAVVINSDEVLESTKYSICDWKGKEVLGGTVAEKTTKFQISTEKLSSGTYFLKLNCSNGKVIQPQKIVIIH